MTVLYTMLVTLVGMVYFIFINWLATKIEWHCNETTAMVFIAVVGVGLPLGLFLQFS